VRVFLSALLTVLILACPFICGAAEAIHLARGHHAGSSPIVPAHCPEDSDDCICRGAVQSADVRVPGVDAISSLLPLHGLVGILDHAPAYSLAHLTSDGSPTGLAGWGDAVTVRAVLQNFRC
jgi:hypothetical protein